jgi:RecA-family ATPase
MTIANVIAMVSGRNLIGDAPHQPLRVWYWNGEDPRDEIERRIAATCIHYRIGPDDIEDRLFFDLAAIRKSSSRHKPNRARRSSLHPSKPPSPQP